MKITQKTGKIRFYIGIALQICGIGLFLWGVYGLGVIWIPEGSPGLEANATPVLSFVAFLGISLFFIGRALSRTVRVEFPDQ